MTGLPCSAVLIALGAVGVLGVVLVATGNQKGESTVAGYVGLAFLVALGVIGIITFIPVWANRGTRILIDHTGLWVERKDLRNVIPWHTLAGAGLYWSRLGRKGRLYSLELYPNGPIDRDDPVLWALVRDEEPPRPALPRLRHRLPLVAADQRAVVAAVQQYVPQIWLGESQRPPGHIGRPDVKGHRERTRGRTP
ncbi:hypothetical protein [Streptomyces sp. NA02950]|uniref:hypothetical protein n=1 Tax=Streptomyces sp. NA02950 TaxID=2742137 RepID=UPI0020CB6598|nr:hypothetical protein [Streptomyces sp. NA02950]